MKIAFHGNQLSETSLIGRFFGFFLGRPSLRLLTSSHYFQKLQRSSQILWYVCWCKKQLQTADQGILNQQGAQSLNTSRRNVESTISIKIMERQQGLIFNKGAESHEEKLIFIIFVLLVITYLVEMNGQGLKHLSSCRETSLRHQFICFS